MTRLCVVVGASPWGGSLASSALRFVRTAVGAGYRPTVFFHNDGVYNALPGGSSDGGFESPQAAWSRLGNEDRVDLLLCPAASSRRISESMMSSLPACWRQAGLTRLLEIMEASDRMVHF